MQIRLFSCVALCLMAVSAQADTVALDSDTQKMSYLFGYNIGQKLKSQIPDLDEGIFAQAMHDAMANQASRLTEEQSQQTIAAYQKKRQEAFAKLAEKNLEAGKEFLAANKKKKGVVTLPSGVQYKIIKSAKGAKPTATDRIVAHYRGTLINGKEFDSSIKRGQPATFSVNGVIAGWQEVLPLMPVGSTWQVYIPAALAYGERGADENIGPNETLIFDIELLKIEQPDTK